MQSLCPATPRQADLHGLPWTVLSPQVLVFLETVCQRGEAAELVSDLAVKLLQPLLTEEMLDAGMPGSDTHSIKLRSMQVRAGGGCG